jgi:hypothetical protein
MTKITKEFILAEMKRTAANNGGVPLGAKSFANETAIRKHEWERYWAKFSDLQAEAGLQRLTRNAPIAEATMLKRLAELARELGRRPTVGEIRVAKRKDQTVPSVEAVLRLGNFAEITEKLRAFCETDAEFADVFELLPPQDHQEHQEEAEAPDIIGGVYLIKSSKHYKIGRSNAAGRREREIALQLPEKAAMIHEIKTDDPVGIERYWHERFAAKRLNGEWFALDARDVAAFKRRKKFM